MKINKKLLIPVFATAMGLSVMGGLGGAVAWYQYNSKVSASFVGASVADTGVLQISEDGSNWTRAIDKTSNPKMQLRPVTFGNTASGVNGDAWMYPEAGAGNGYYEATDRMPGWVKAVEGQDYIQFSLFFQAYQTDTVESSGYKYVQREVYLNNYYLRCLDESGDEITSGKNGDEAMRIQFDLADQNVHTILAKSAGSTQLHDGLDLDGSGLNDSYHKTPFIDLPSGGVDGAEIVYGNASDADQETKAISSYLAAGGQKLFKTSGTSTPVEVVVTIWLEGWAALDNSSLWNAKKASGCDIQVALEFTTGEFRGADLTQVNP